MLHNSPCIYVEISRIMSDSQSFKKRLVTMSMSCLQSKHAHIGLHNRANLAHYCVLAVLNLPSNSPTLKHSSSPSLFSKVLWSPELATYQIL